VIHVDYNKSAWDNNTINTTKNHPRYTLIPADGKLDVYGEVSAQQFVASLKGDVWPGTSGNTELTNTSVPAAKVYTGGYMNKPIRGIKYTDGIISFNFMGGSFVAPVVSQATDVTETSFVANWEAVEGAEEYNVELYKVTEAADGSGDAATLLSEDFVGCTKTNTDVSATIDDCTATSGWTGKYVYSEGGVLRVGSSKNAGTLTTPIFNATGEVSLSFSAALYNSADTGVKLTVSMKDATGATLASKDVEPAVAMEVYTLAAEVNGEFHVEFTTSASSGKKRVNVDNITLSATLSFSSECVERVSTNELSYKFAELEAGAKYRYRVQAKDAYGASAFSDYMDVQMTPTSIDGIAVEDSTVEVYTLGGVKVYSGAKDAVTVPYSGVYVVKTASKAIKVLF